MPDSWAAIAIKSPKFDTNVGGVLRSAHAFGFDAAIIVSPRPYRRQATDTSNAKKHMPVITLETPGEVVEMAEEIGAEIVLIEVGGTDIREFNHPSLAIYIVGPEDGSVLQADYPGSTVVGIASKYCLNMAVAASIVMHERNSRCLAVTVENS